MDEENRLVVTRGERGWREGKMGKGGQLYGDKYKLDFWGSSLCSVDKYQLLKMYTCNLYNVIYQVYLD